jgi:hypothetical protein
MTLSRVIMVLSLAVLAYILFNTVSNEDNESFQSEVEDYVDNIENSENTQELEEDMIHYPAPNSQIDYEHFEAMPATDELASAPVTQAITVEEADEEQIDGTDVLAAASADRFTGVNSIATVNGNASNDLRGDPVLISYDDSVSIWNNSASRGDRIHTNSLN